jgi:hypothetical protein
MMYGGYRQYTKDKRRMWEPESELTKPSIFPGKFFKQYPC